MDLSIVKILVVVASILVKSRYAEVGKGSLSTVFVQRLAGPKCNSNLVYIRACSFYAKGKQFNITVLCCELKGNLKEIGLVGS